MKNKLKILSISLLTGSCLFINGCAALGLSNVTKYQAEAPEGGSMNYSYTDANGNKFDVTGAKKALITERARGKGVGLAAKQALEKVTSDREGILGGSVKAGLDTYSGEAQEEIVRSVTEGVVSAIKPGL